MIIRNLHSREWNSWWNAKERCRNKNTKAYKLYGGRGIKVCDRWINSFNNFLEDMGVRPEGDYSLDRIDNNGNYEPNNCRWADRKTQNSNKRFPLKPLIKIKYCDESRTLQGWRRFLKISNRNYLYDVKKKHNLSDEEVVEKFYLKRILKQKQTVFYQLV